MISSLTVLHALLYASLVANNIFLLLVFTITIEKPLVLTCDFKSSVTPVTFVSCTSTYHIKRN